MTCDAVIIIRRGQVVASSTLSGLTDKAGGQVIVVVESESPMDTEPIKKLSGVVRLESEPAPSGNRLRVVLDGRKGLTTHISALAIKQGWSLREVRHQKRSLEEMFVELVQEEEATV